jgi:hypothetical protein
MRRVELLLPMLPALALPSPNSNVSFPEHEKFIWFPKIWTDFERSGQQYMQSATTNWLQIVMISLGKWERSIGGLSGFLFICGLYSQKKSARNRFCKHVSTASLIFDAFVAFTFLRLWNWQKCDQWLTPKSFLAKRSGRADRLIRMHLVLSFLELIIKDTMTL